MTSNEKSLNNKVVDLVECYSFVKVLSLSDFIPKSYDLFKRRCLYRHQERQQEPLQYPARVTVATAVLNGGSEPYAPTTVSYDGRSLPPFTVVVGDYFCQLRSVVYFCKITERKIYIFLKKI
jgi:hypothetical protein